MAGIGQHSPVSDAWSTGGSAPIPVIRSNGAQLVHST